MQELFGCFTARGTCLSQNKQDSAKQKLGATEQQRRQRRPAQGQLRPAANNSHGGTTSAALLLLAIAALAISVPGAYASRGDMCDFAFLRRLQMLALAPRLYVVMSILPVLVSGLLSSMDTHLLCKC